ncbi:MAG: tripartite tricarboxylate transporter substrate binding protein [Betaproteobacteria bacterium]|nr:tripartite tricarboxylate transporter substrate binding protein [Betaproteobacteria bacterium]
MRNSLDGIPSRAAEGKICARDCALALVVSLLSLVMPMTGHGQSYPHKPVRIIVPFTPGSATDIMARTVGEKLSAGWGQPVLVENRAGAGGTIGAGVVAKSTPDGYTLLVVSAGHVVNPALYKDIAYDTIGDFAGVIPLGNIPSVLVVASASPIKSVRDLVATARAAPGKLNFASAGIGSATHVNTEKFRAATGIDVVHIPFKGTPETIAETISGRVDFMFTPIVASIPSIRDGRMRAIGVSTARRVPALPDVPTVAEAGVPGFEFNFWIGLLAPSKTPRDIIAKLNAETARALQQPDVSERLSKIGAEPMPMTPERFDAYIREEFVALGSVMRGAANKP